MDDGNRADPAPRTAVPAGDADLSPLIMFAAGTGNDHGRGDVGAAVHTPDGLRVTAIVGALIGAGVTFGALCLQLSYYHTVAWAPRRSLPASWGSSWL